MGARSFSLALGSSSETPCFSNISFLCRFQLCVDGSEVLSHSFTCVTHRPLLLLLFDLEFWPGLLLEPPTFSTLSVADASNCPRAVVGLALDSWMALSHNGRDGSVPVLNLSPPLGYAFVAILTRSKLPCESMCISALGSVLVESGLVSGRAASELDVGRAARLI